VCSTRTRQYFCVRQYFAVYYTQSRQYTIVCTTHNQDSTLTLTRLLVGVLSWLCVVHTMSRTRQDTCLNVILKIKMVFVGVLSWLCVVHERDSTYVSMWHWRSRWFSLRRVWNFGVEIGEWASWGLVFSKIKKPRRSNRVQYTDETVHIICTS